jgi:hypothetical protein
LSASAVTAGVVFFGGFAFVVFVGGGVFGRVRRGAARGAERSRCAGAAFDARLGSMKTPALLVKSPSCARALEDEAAQRSAAASRQLKKLGS